MPKTYPLFNVYSIPGVHLYPTVATILAEPLLRNAHVNAEISVISGKGEEPYFRVREETVKLELPTVTKAEYESLPREFEIRVKKPFQSMQAMAANFYFTFKVSILGAESLPNGELKLDYRASLVEYKKE